MEVAVKSDPSVEVINKIQNPRVNFLRPSQMVEHQEDIDRCQTDLQNRDVQNKGAVQGRLHNLKKQFDLQAPKPITDGRVKDALAKRELELREKWTQGMLSQEEMRKNPVGAVDKHRKWEKANKAAILEWKKIRLAMQADNSHPDSWDRDVANIEAYRPEGPVNRLRTDAQITGKMSYGHVPEENWNMAFQGKGPENTALKQAERVAADKPKRQFTEEQKQAMRDRLALARAKRKTNQQIDEQDRPAEIVLGEQVPHEEA